MNDGAAQDGPERGSSGRGGEAASAGGFSPRGASGRGGVALEKAVLYVTWLVPVLEQFPRSQRFLLGDRLQGLALDTVEALVEATYTKAPVDALRRVNLKLEQQRLMVRVAYNLRYLGADRHGFTCRGCLTTKLSRRQALARVIPNCVLWCSRLVRTARTAQVQRHGFLYR